LKDDEGPDALVSIEDDSVDYVITTNLNSIPWKMNDLFKECYRVLRQGGELCFSGQFSTLRVKCISDRNQFLLKPFYIEVANVV
jgi:ubiquinone/menaquinone biosynthesis C-methylase UbiE